MVGLVPAFVIAGSLLIQPGRPAPAMVARTMTGKVWRSPLRGEVTIVEFSATWCPHCRNSLAGYRQLLASRRVRLIVVDVDEDPAVVSGYFARHPLPPGAALLIDLEERARKTWGVKDYPTVYLIDKRGVIRDSFAGWDDAGGVRYLARAIDALNRPASGPKVAEAATSPRRQNARKQAAHAR
jgi:thiol-disulfide isomerase/thioredoxin